MPQKTLNFLVGSGSRKVSDQDQDLIELLSTKTQLSRTNLLKTEKLREINFGEKNRKKK